MNTTLTTVLYTSKTLSDGTHPLMLRLTKIVNSSLHIPSMPNFGTLTKDAPSGIVPISSASTA